MSLAAPDFSTVFDIGPCHEALFEGFTHRELRALARGVGNRELRDLIGVYLRRYPIRQADVRAGEHVALLHHHAKVVDLRLELPPATYTLVRGQEWNAAHMLNADQQVRSAGHSGGLEAYDDAAAAWRAWRPQWRLGYGPLQLAAGVTIVGQAEGVKLTFEGFTNQRLVDGAEGARFESVSFP